MSDHEQPGHGRPTPADPWASLADELGIDPTEPAKADGGHDRPATPLPSRPTPPRAKPPKVERPRESNSGGGWDDLASSLGLEPDARPSAPPPRPVGGDRPRPPRAEPGGDRPPSRPDADHAAADATRRAPPPSAGSDRERRRDDRDAFGQGPRPARGEGERRHDRPRLADEGGFAAGVFDGARRDDDERDHRAPRVTDSGAGPDRGGDRSLESALDDRSGESRGTDEGDHGTGERRSRRRRGRRGGRGRRPRDGERIEGGIRDRRDDEPLRDDLVGPAIRPTSPDELWEGERPAASADRPERAEDDATDAPRRRRRGRRGGRGRGRGGRSGSEARPGDAASGMGADDAALGDRTAGERHREDDSDEPLPGGYGVRPAARNEGDERGSRSPADRSTDQGSEGEGGGRSRRRGRRRRSGDGGRANGGEGSATSESSRRSSRARRERRPAAEPRGEARGDAGFARRRRSDFAPVGSGHDEDDEGLEFLGLDESGTGSPRRDARPVTDDILVESGLASVQDVPSWVEAIGIVIAGNLDARSRSTRGDDGRRGGR